MMKKIFTLLLITSALFSEAQHLSKGGRIISTYNTLNYSVNTNAHQSTISFQQHQFIGNHLLETNNGFLSIDGNYENSGSTIYVYNAQDELIFQKKYPQTINLVLSENKKYAAFYNRGEVTVLNLQNFSEKSIEASVIFSLNNEGELAHVNSTTNTMHVDGQVGSAASMLFAVTHYNQQVYFLSKKSIYTFSGNQFVELYTSNTEIFDFKVINHQFYISEKNTTSSAYEFSLKNTDDFSELHTQETKTYTRIIASNDKQKRKLPARLQNLDNETIRNPMDFSSDSSYQSIGNSYNELQDYDPANPYLHPGVDLFGNHLENVHSVKAGYIKAILTTSGDFHWRVAIANENTPDSSQGYLYAHLDQNLIPFNIGDTIAEGEVIGQLVDFPVQGFVHCHFARIVDEGMVWSGTWWTFDNPLHYMENFIDETPPVFEDVIPGHRIGLRDFGLNYHTKDSVSGYLNIVSKVYDEMNTFWHVDVHQTGYSIAAKSTPNIKLIDKQAYNFDMFNDTYFNGAYTPFVIQSMYAFDGTCISKGNYDEREFYHVLSNSDGDDTITTADFNNGVDFDALPSGEYIIKVWAKDAVGNYAEDSMLVNVKSFVGVSSKSKQNIQVYPNPTNGFINIKKQTAETNRVQLLDITGRVLQEVLLDGLYTKIDILNYPSGIYLLKFDDGVTVKLISQCN